MTELVISRHAESRMRQRGLRDSDLHLLIDVATPLADDAFLMSNAATDREIARRRREIQQLERLRGCKIVVAENTVVTVCHTSPASRRRAFRRGREHR